jgi:hypothetical protein
MRRPSRKTAIALAILAAPALAIATALPASATGTGPWNIWLENGSQAVGAASVNAGTSVIDVAHPGRNMTFDQQGTDANGFGYGYFKFYTGTFMAATNVCSGVTIKSSGSSNGTIWVLWISGGHLYLISRYCSGGANHYGSRLASSNLPGDQWFIGTGISGQFVKIVLNPA